jgi:hypothetical protein
MKRSKVVDFLKKAPLEELAPICEVLAERFNAHRMETGGVVPLSLYPFVVGIGGIYVCYEVVIKTPAGYALKMRDAGNGEQGWHGQYHIPGVAWRPQGDTFEKVMGRLSREIYGDDAVSFSLNDLEFAGVVVHYQPERLTDCKTMMFLLPCDKVPKGDWKIFSGDELKNETIVNHHRNTLAWISDKNRPVVADLRNGYVKR